VEKVLKFIIFGTSITISKFIYTHKENYV